MLQRVFVRVVGFSGVERHALNTVFRLSQDPKSTRDWSYEPWDSGMPNAPQLALIDGSSPDASEALAEIEAAGGIGLIWVGSISPAKAWSSFQRPLSWPAILASLDDYFTPRDQLDVDFGDDTWPSVLESTGAHMFNEQDLRRALVADADGDARMYLQSKLASFGITQIDHAANVLEATDLLGSMKEGEWHYDIVIVDLDLPGGDSWKVLSAAGSPSLKLVTQSELRFAQRVAAKAKGWTAMSKPLDPSRLNELLSKVP
jgi:CheY-like chemotaxis protein